MSQEHTHTLNWHTGEKQFDSECVAQSVRMSVWNLSEFKEATQPRLPAAYDAIELAPAAPKEMLVRHAWRLVQCFQDEIGQNHVDRLACFLHIEEETAALDTVFRHLDGVADPHSAVSQQEQQAWQSPGIIHAVR